MSREVAHNNKLSTIEWNVNVWSKERDSGLCVCVCVCVWWEKQVAIRALTCARQHLRIETQSETHPYPVLDSPRILLMEELCMSGYACRILLRSSLAHTMKAFMGLLMWPEEGGGRASA